MWISEIEISFIQSFVGQILSWLSSVVCLLKSWFTLIFNLTLRACWPKNTITSNVGCSDLVYWHRSSYSWQTLEIKTCTEKKPTTANGALCNCIKSFIVSQISRLGHLTKEQKRALLQKHFKKYALFIENKVRAGMQGLKPHTVS